MAVNPLQQHGEETLMAGHFGSDRGAADAWLGTLIRSLREPQSSPLGERLPGFPSEELQQNTTGLSSEAAIRQAHAFYENVLDAAHKAGLRLDARTRALDFGFGWGRISRTFMEHLSVQNIRGLDVDPFFVETTQQLFGSQNFQQCSAFPPTTLDSGSVDLIFSYSVFSHLSEAACRSWMAEFARLLAPGGLVAFTTRHETFFDFCEWARTCDPATASPYVLALGGLFPDIRAARQAYRDGQIVHASSIGVAGGGPRDASFYGETWLPEAYVKAQFADDFEFVAGYFDGSKYDQACFALKRKG
jgi:hypothetical protein